MILVDCEMVGFVYVEIWVKGIDLWLGVVLKLVEYRFVVILLSVELGEFFEYKYVEGELDLLFSNGDMLIIDILIMVIGVCLEIKLVVEAGL